MTDLEVLQRAKLYLEKLANGINPLTDLPVSEEDIVNNVRISRCLFYTADVLRQVIEQGGLKAKDEPRQKRSEKKPFDLPHERRVDFAFEDEALPLSVITRKINALINEEETQRLRAKSISAWLVHAGVLQELTTETGRKEKRPTDAGMLLGVYMQTVSRDDGREFVMNLYPREAQEFILSHLDSIAEIDRATTRQRAEKHQAGKNQGLPWDKEQERRLVQLYRQGVDIREIANQLERSQGSISARMKKLGLFKDSFDAM